MNPVRLAVPWQRYGALYSAPGTLVLKISLGEAPESIPAAYDIRRRRLSPVSRFRIHAVDRVLAHFSDRVRITRVHMSAASIRQMSLGHQAYDDLEQLLGLARTFRVETARSCCISDLVDALRQVAVVDEAGPQYLTTAPLDEGTGAAPNSATAWASREMVRASEALAYEPGDPAVIVAIVDSGVVATHPEIERHLRAGLDTVQLTMDDVAMGIKLVGDRAGIDTDPLDIVGHGTSCAGIIGAVGTNMPPGLGGECGMMPIRVLGGASFPGKTSLVGIGALSDIDCGMKSAIDLGAKVINMSFGTPVAALEPNDPRPHEDVVRYALMRGCVLVAASGNSGREEQYLPAACPGVIAVGAVRDDGRPADFSTRGDHVALSAPGERIVSAGLEGYAVVTGTSFAAPFVSAAAALLVSRAARRAYPIDGSDVRRLLCDAAQPWRAGAGAGLGAGILDAYLALELLDREIDRTYAPEEPRPAATSPPTVQYVREA